MSNILAKLQDIEERLQKFGSLVEKYASPRSARSKGKSRKRGQQDWTALYHIMKELVGDVREIKEKLEGPTIYRSPDRIARVDGLNTTPEPLLQTSERPPGERQQPIRNSSFNPEDEGTQNRGPIFADTGAKANCQPRRGSLQANPDCASTLQPGELSSGPLEGAQNVEPIFANPGAKADTQAIPTPQLSGSTLNENRIRAVSTTVSTTVSIGAESPELRENAAASISIPRRSRRLVTSTPSQPDKSTHSVSEIPRSPDITIPYREEHGVIVLLPLNIDQCRDTPFLLSQAEALGARETGVFKYVLPTDSEFSVQAFPSITTYISKFKSDLRPNGIHHISRTAKLGTLDIGDTTFTPMEPDELAEMLESRLANPRAMSKMRYATDSPAWTAKDRQQLGLPIESPIWPLKGNLLDRTKYIVNGLHRPFGYISGDYGSIFVIHSEDNELTSFNVLHWGQGKLWNVVSRKDGYLVVKEVGGGNCAQAVRHASDWIPRRKLSAMGASFVNFIQRPGEVVVVFGDIYHQGGTLGPTNAEAVNYGDSNWSVEGYSECSSTCPTIPILNELLEFRGPNEPQREQEDEASPDADEASPDADEASPDADEASPDTDEASPEARDSTQSGGRQRIARNAPRRIGKAVNMDLSVDRSLQKRQRNPFSTLNSRAKRICTTQSAAVTTMVSENSVWVAPISQMVAAICSRDAIKQFLDIVRGRRELEPTALRMNLSKDSTRNHDPTQMLENDIKFIDMFSRKTAFHNFLTRIYQARLAQHAEEIKQSREKEINQKCERILKGDIKKILKGTRMTERQYYHHRERGTKWRGYCGMFPGILSFIPFQTQAFEFSATDWVRLKDIDFNSLRRHLTTQNISALCSAGKRFEASLDLTTDDVEFVGESKSISLDKVSPECLISYLKPVLTTDENIYQENAYPNWRRPKDWPEGWDWPINPTFIPPSEKQCSFCNESGCDCAGLRPEIQPRIRIYEGKGRGLQAVAKKAGHIAYPKKTRLGELMGRLVPPNTYHNGRCYALLREDLDFGPEVAQIYCGEERSIFGLMNHDHEPTVTLRGERVSGQYRVGVYTTRDVRDGEELTYDYGKGFWGNRKCPCPTCHVT